jgi:hypothetical protein
VDRGETWTWTFRIIEGMPTAFAIAVKSSSSTLPASSTKSTNEQILSLEARTKLDSSSTILARSFNSEHLQSGCNLNSTGYGIFRLVDNR